MLIVQMNLFAKQTDIDIENKSMDTKGGRKGGMDWEMGIDI